MKIKHNVIRPFWHYLNVNITEGYDAADNISKKKHFSPLDNLV